MGGDICSTYGTLRRPLDISCPLRALTLDTIPIATASTRAPHVVMRWITSVLFTSSISQSVGARSRSYDLIIVRMGTPGHNFAVLSLSPAPTGGTPDNRGIPASIYISRRITDPVSTFRHAASPCIRVASLRCPCCRGGEPLVPEDEG